MFVRGTRELLRKWQNSARERVGGSSAHKEFARPPLQKIFPPENLRLEPAFGKENCPRNRPFSLHGASRRAPKILPKRDKFYSGYIVRPSSNLFPVAERLTSHAPRAWWLLILFAGGDLNWNGVAKRRGGLAYYIIL